MKKLFLILFFVFTASLAVAQVDTFSLRNMPGNYYVKDWPDYSAFNQLYHYSDGHFCLLAWIDEAVRCLNYLPNNFGGAHQFSIEDTAAWNSRHILNYATSKYADRPINISGVAMILPQRLTMQVDWSIRELFLANGFDALVLQVLDTGMNVVAEGATLLEDSIGRPLFEINIERQEIYELMTFYSRNYYDIYEVLFDTVITVTDSFYLAAYFRSYTQTEEGRFGIAAPGIYELHRYGYSHYVDSSHYYDMPKFTNHALGGYNLIYNNTVIDTVPMPDNEWFTIEACEENHGFAMIFPILAVDCEAPDSVVWAPIGGGNVRVSWEQGQWTSGWEVSYGPTGTLPGEGTVLQTTAPAAMLSGITMDTDYVVYVRSLCTVRDTVWSEWSAGMPFTLRDQDIEAVSDADLTLVPNPTSGAVLLTAEAEITGVEVYTSAGVPFLRLPASGRTVRFDTSTWPAGTYLLEVSTAQGTTTKRLVVTR